MKKEIHSKNYRYVVFRDTSNGEEFLTRSCAATKETTTYDGEEYPLYSLGISILKALAEGLEGEFRKHCEASYKIDKTYEGGAPAREFGRFWFKLPWPKRNLKKSLRLLQEAVALGPKRVMNHLFLGETLMAIGKKADGRKEVERVLSSEELDPEEAPDVPRYRKQAESVLAEL